jgi:RimJ/RimL family protein N-acetyltransferase
MKLKALSMFDCEQVRQWRNLQLEILRTPLPLTMEQQSDFYKNVVCDRKSNAKYWGIWFVGKQYKAVDMGHCIMQKDCIGLNLIGMCGLENISLENRNAEISLIFNPEYPMGEYGEEALKLLLHEGFMSMNLENIYTEVYAYNSNMPFWTDVVIKYNCITAFLPDRKYYNGLYYTSTYININKGAYTKNENTFIKSTCSSD